jgi:anti-anti-sigma factor
MMQQFSLLVTVAPAARATFPALRALVRAAHAIRMLPGFRAWRSYRALDASDALVFVLEWADAAACEAARPKLDALARRAEAGGLRVQPFRVLLPAFDRRLALEPAAASLLRLGPASPADEDCALRALAAPGTTRVVGARTEDGELTVSRIEFEGEDGLWPFLESPLRYRWSERSLGETWALNLPRLEFLSAAGEEPLEAPASRRPGLSVDLSLSDDGLSARIRLRGQVDAAASARAERFCESLIAQGCRSLHVDVSGLTGISEEALLMLARAARNLRGDGGSFTLVDNARRVRRVTRVRELDAILR